MPSDLLLNRARLFAKGLTKGGHASASAPVNTTTVLLRTHKIRYVNAINNGSISPLYYSTVSTVPVIPDQLLK
jgi:hypothetical protein